MFSELIKLIISFIIVNIIFYLLFSFIALSFNPMTWWIIQSVAGRVLFVLLEVIIFGIALNLSDELSDGFDYD